jgi:hypothetical protein
MLNRQVNNIVGTLDLNHDRNPTGNKTRPLRRPAHNINNQTYINHIAPHQAANEKANTKTLQPTQK